ncbi:hypothetical protein AV530_013012 [Patagioenas fasciata monilis]|uniref:Uncharacterized protein n=1 Tax=Patagioenas fasciata monilis TaxID=372326 RepID=A0A1V4J9U1_PATFA|nr:hypothetical protein AV530_013012 [Patagioenas fasciata monilis]
MRSLSNQRLKFEGYLQKLPSRPIRRNVSKCKGSWISQISRSSLIYMQAVSPSHLFFSFVNKRGGQAAADLQDSFIPESDPSAPERSCDIGVCAEDKL